MFSPTLPAGHQRLLARSDTPARGAHVDLVVGVVESSCGTRVEVRTEDNVGRRGAERTAWETVLKMESGDAKVGRKL